MKYRAIFILTLTFIFQAGFSQNFTMEQLGKFTFPTELTASADGQMIAWAMFEQGKRNIYMAKSPDFEPMKMTSFNTDDGQEITGLTFSSDGDWLVFVRGGDHGGYLYSSTVNVDNLPTLPKVEIWKMNISSKELEVVLEADDILTGSGDEIAFLKNGKVWTHKLGSSDSPNQLFEIKGSVNSMSYSPDGSKLAFTVSRGGHQLLGVFHGADKPIQWIAPSFHRYSQPVWSPDGSRIAFIKRLGGQGAALSLLERRHQPWEIWLGALATGEAEKLWKAPETIPASYRYGFFAFPEDDKIIFESYEDGWQHLYSLNTSNGDQELLTPGDYMVEQIKLSPDHGRVLFAANAGEAKEDIDRRHIGSIDVASGELTWETSGEGIEAYPVALANGQDMAYFSATTHRPHLVTVRQGNNTRLLQEDIIPADFPMADLVTPKQVTFLAPDGTTVHGQLFEPKNSSGESPGVVFVHGGPQRQMLLGWSYMDYYTNTYAINQYLASQGFVVLSVNFRLGIGYGYEFHRPAFGYYQGAVEYQDVKAGAEYLANLSQVDGDRIGIYGGSYGGYLTSLALARDSDLFKVGVDIHGVHDMDGRYDLPEGYEVAPDYEEAKEIAWKSSPMPDLDKWTSPVLFIHSDDDRNVNVSQTTNLIRRFEELGKPYESILIPGDTHHWMKWANLMRVDQATADFLKKHLMDN